MNTLPLFFNLENRSALIIGGGEVAHRKAALLLRAGAIVTLVAPKFDERFFSSTQANLVLIEQSYDKQYLANQTLVICATDNEHVNRQVYQDCQYLNIPVNVVDNPAQCSFIFPAIIDRDPITVAVSSGGKAPVLARLLRAKLETVIPPQYGELANLAGKFRDKVKQTLPSITARRKFWEHVFEGQIAETVFSHRNHNLEDNNLTLAENQFEHLLKQHANNQPIEQADHGKVYIVGAGAGDPDLLTFKALRYMQRADIVFYDNLVSPQILDLCRRDATKIYVGKKASEHSVGQEKLNDLLVEHARQGKRVVRLKGGDPYVFGRGGEEAQRLAEADVDFEVVPGITAAIAAASGAGIPLTHRDYAQSVKFITACLKTDTLNENVTDLLDDTQTVVFYMGLKQLDKLTATLIQAGKNSQTPIAIVSEASLPNQQVLTGTLDDIVKKQAVANLPAPAIIIMGEVVKLYDILGK